MSPNNFESIIFVVNRSLVVGLISGAQAARRGRDDPGDSDALVTELARLVFLPNLVTAGSWSWRV